jgi:hypothetical protein
VCQRHYHELAIGAGKQHFAVEVVLLRRFLQVDPQGRSPPG